MIEEITPRIELPYKTWLSLARQAAAVEEALRAKKPAGMSVFDFKLDDYKDEDYYRQYAELFAPFADACVYQFRLTQDESGWKGARSWFAHCALWTGEANAYRAILQRPSRIRGGVLESPKIIEVLPTRLGEVATDKQLLDRLLTRLKSLSPYESDPLPDAPEWLWHISGSEHWNLLLENGRVRFPESWKMSLSCHGPVQFHGDRLQVIDNDGFSGLIDPEGILRVPCRYAYLLNLGLDSGAGARAEACEQWDDQACDLIDGDGKRMNPPGIKVIPDSYQFGTAIVRRAGTAKDGLQGYIDRDGTLLGEIRWRRARQHWHGYAAVLCAETGLWGYVNETGAVTAEPRFTVAGTVNDGFAIVEVDNSGLQGVIDTTGKLVIEPIWQEVDAFDRTYFRVTDGEGRMGLVDQRGALVVAPRHLGIEVKEPDYMYGQQCRDELRQALYEQMRENLLTLRARAKDSLAPFAGAFRCDADERDLTVAGLWLAEVVLLEEYHGLPAGTSGRISYYYPVSANIFDWSQEVPVTGLYEGNPERTLGVPWGVVRLA